MNTASSSGEQPDSGLTLLRLRLWTEDMKLKLKQMSTIVDEAKSESIVWMTMKEICAKRSRRSQNHFS